LVVGFIVGWQRLGIHFGSGVIGLAIAIGTIVPLLALRVMGAMGRPLVGSREWADLCQWKDATSPRPGWIPPQRCQLAETAPSGPQGLHEIKLGGFPMSARIERGNVQLLTRRNPLVYFSQCAPSSIAPRTAATSAGQSRIKAASGQIASSIWIVMRE